MIWILKHLRFDSFFCVLGKLYQRQTFLSGIPFAPRLVTLNIMPLCGDMDGLGINNPVLISRGFAYEETNNVERSLPPNATAATTSTGISIVRTNRRFLKTNKID